MSVSAYIKTTYSLEPQDFFKHLADKGEKIVITSDEFPTLRLGTHCEALRGVEISKEDFGYEVRVCTFSSTADYKLFISIIDGLVEITGNRFYNEEDEENFVQTTAAEHYTNDWIAMQREGGFNTVKALTLNSGTPVVMNGLFAQFCVGPILLDDFSDPNPEEELNRLEKYLVSIQWYLADKQDTSTDIVLPATEGAKDQSDLSVSLIAIEDGKVREFDYISYAGILGIMDFDGGCPAFIHFHELWRFLPPRVFRRIDDYQFERIGKLTPKMVRKMIEDSRVYQSQRFKTKPKFPGFGHDEKQNTFILMWNPEISSAKLPQFIDFIPDMLTVNYNWSVWEHEKAVIYDKFYLVRCGNGNTGIVMSGIFCSNPYESDDWSGKGRLTFYMDLQPSVMLNPDKAPMLTTAELEEAIPSFNWRGGHSGRMLSDNEAKKLEELWANYINEHTKDADNINMSMTILH